MKLPYNPSDKNSIIEYAKKLKGKSLRQVCDPTVLEHSYSGKGNFGQVLEKFYFGYEPNSVAEADFAQIGMELKSSPLKQLKNDEFRSKERLVLNIINYVNVVNQNFENSDFFKKNASILLIFYLHNAGYDILDYLIKLVDEWSFPSTDLEIIKKDWQTINEKIANGKAHELSEGDTFYLGACTKGANALSVRKQPFSEIPAKQRAYSFKQGYVNHIIASIAKENKGIYGKLIPNVQVAKKQTIEEIVISKFKPFYGKTEEEIIKILKIKINTKAKSFYASLTKAILGIELDKEIEEFEKAEIIVKTVRLKENDLPKEDISFPNFKYEEIVNEDWEDSDFKDVLEHKFLFVFFQFENEKLILRKVKFWNMPYLDLIEVEKVWTKTKQIVAKGEIVKEIKTNKKGKEIRFTNFPSKKFSSISHVRPHAKDSSDTFELPKKDKLTKQNEYTKHCFWLNNTYVKNEIYLK
ncbi:DNA mismatch repair protein [Flavobacterium psychrophilum]|uniref:Sau3AI family type II restriction endonuclease n=1 Tax=Flavobacterium psychrophilum TaxID=96345 RepID=UPI0004F59075|nr:Sau3AI family type II restriction endonuclease [Flavobacterium psychrophilum]AIN74101.1 DNA mismatch repair protein [Flavobacterium psychrophilum FPG3]EKT2070462.1 DNA mismatch repair protein [Flavobacterium psychrophilum]EKT2072804.1 DNA mismatch repair protein [Flavobacterium psychrophilum]EKT4492264.1 DNA mismatch repair protein [Flavobacterium psychrophilum]MBF2045127.1 DNA mismatch repair protein [Flavobacterium psychrophilum]